MSHADAAPHAPHTLKLTLPNELLHLPLAQKKEALADIGGFPSHKRREAA